MPRFKDKDRWGGAWTELKLDTLERYLRFYTQALKNQPSPSHPFSLHYIDAFAGNGSVNIARKRAGEAARRDRVIGSALRALDVSPPFSRLEFIEIDKERADELTRLCSEKFPDRDVQVHTADANAHIRSICDSTDWRATRAVLFIDPYGMDFEFATLQRVAETQAIDVWYLFPTSAMSRQMARRRDRVSSDKEQALTRLLGDDSWQTLYAPSPQADLFGGASQERLTGIDAMEAHAKQRLETIFPSVLPPKRMTLRGDGSGATLFSLFFAISNPAPKAIGLSTKVARHLLRGQAGAG